MAKRSLFYYVFISFFLISALIFFAPEQWIISPLNIVIFAIIFNFVIGTHWKESFELAIINYVWILILSLFVTISSIVMIAQGQSGTPPKLLWVILLMIIGIPITQIKLNWTGKRHFDYSSFDKLLYKIKGPNRKNKKHKLNRNFRKDRTQKSYKKHRRRK